MSFLHIVNKLIKSLLFSAVVSISSETRFIRKCFSFTLSLKASKLTSELKLCRLILNKLKYGKLFHMPLSFMANPFILQSFFVGTCLADCFVSRLMWESCDKHFHYIKYLYFVLLLSHPPFGTCHDGSPESFC